MSTFEFLKTERQSKCCKCLKECHQGGVLYDSKNNKEIHRAICSEKCLKSILKNGRYLTVEQWEQNQLEMKTSEKNFKKVQNKKKILQKKSLLDTQNSIVNRNVKQFQIKDGSDDSSETTSQGTATPVQTTRQQSGLPATRQQQQAMPITERQQTGLPVTRQASSETVPGEKSSKDSRLSEIERRRSLLEQQIREAEEQSRLAQERRRKLQEERERLLLEEQQRESLRDNLRDTIQNNAKSQKLKELFDQDEIIDLYAPIYKDLTPLERQNLRSILLQAAQQKLQTLVKENIRDNFKSWLNSDENIAEIQKVFSTKEIFNISSRFAEEGEFNEEEIDSVRQLLSRDTQLLQYFNQIVNAQKSVLEQFLTNQDSITTLDAVSLRILRKELNEQEIVQQLPTYSEIEKKSLRNNKREQIKKILTKEELSLYQTKIEEEDLFNIQETFAAKPESILEFDKYDIELLRRRRTSRQIVENLPTFSDVEIDSKRSQNRQKVLNILNDEEKQLYRIRLDQESIPETDQPFDQQRQAQLKIQVLRDRPDFTKLSQEERQQLRQVLTLKERVLLIPLETELNRIDKTKIGNVEVLTKEEGELFFTRQFDLWPQPIEKNFITISKAERDNMIEYLSDLEIISLFIPENIEESFSLDSIKEILGEDRFELYSKRKSILKRFQDLNTDFLDLKDDDSANSRQSVRKVLLPAEIVKSITIGVSRKDIENDLNDQEKRWFDKRESYVKDSRNDSQIVKRLSQPRASWELRQLFSPRTIISLLPLDPTEDQESTIIANLNEKERKIYEPFRISNEKNRLQRKKEETEIDDIEKVYQKDKAKFDAPRRELSLGSGIKGSKMFVDSLEQGFEQLAKEFIIYIDSLNKSQSFSGEVESNLESLQDVSKIYDRLLQKDKSERYVENVSILVDLISNTIIGTFWGDKDIEDEDQRLGTLLSSSLTEVQTKIKDVVDQFNGLKFKLLWRDIKNQFFKEKPNQSNVNDTSSILKPIFSDELVGSFQSQFLLAQAKQATDKNQQDARLILQTFINTLKELYDEIEQFTLLIDAIDPNSQESEQFEDATLFFVYELLQYIFGESKTTYKILQSSKDLGQLFALQVLDDVIQKDINDQLDVERQSLQLGQDEPIPEDKRKKAAEFAEEITEDRLKRTLEAFFNA